MTYLHSLTLHLPEFKTDSISIVRWADQILPDEKNKRKFRFLVNRSGILTRYSVLPDFVNPSQMQLYSQANSQDQPDTSLRLKYYEREALKMAAAAAGKCLDQNKISASDITHLIAVSCTGLSAPGLEIKLSHLFGICDYAERYGINFMGCFAAFHAIKQANYICKLIPDAKVLVICAECCTLHFRNTGEEDDLLSTSLFGDGAAAFLMTSKPSAPVHFNLLTTKSQLIYAPEEMSWSVKDDGFEMKLSRDVPSFIGNNINELYHRTAKEIGVENYDYYAIHPGGKNILKAFQQAIGLTINDLRFSYSVLEKYGNMSSPTVLFVLSEILEDFINSGKHSALVYSAAFGPGLTIETAVFELIKNVNR